MKNTHQIVKIRIDTIRDNGAESVYIASNEELGVFVKGASFREVLIDLREILALRLKHDSLSLHFYSPESTQDSGTGVLSGAAVSSPANREKMFN